MTDRAIDLADMKPVSQTEIEARGIKTHQGAAPYERGEDVLERYIRIPNRLFFIYTSEDHIISDYISKNWAALDGLSGDTCDIYTSMLQLENEEDAYSFLGDIRGIPGSEYVSIDALPCILLWSNQASLCLSIKDFANDIAIIRSLLRKIFYLLHCLGRGILGDDEDAISRIVDEVNREVDRVLGKKIVINGGVVMNKSEYKADRGGVVVGGNAHTRDINTSFTGGAELNQIDLDALAKQLSALRKQMKSESDDTDPSHDVAVGTVAVAENAAKSGDREGVFDALKSVGSWALEIAQKIGVDLAASVIKTSINL